MILEWKSKFEGSHILKVDTSLSIGLQYTTGGYDVNLCGERKYIKTPDINIAKNKAIEMFITKMETAINTLKTPAIN